MKFMYLNCRLQLFLKCIILTVLAQLVVVRKALKGEGLSPLQAFLTTP